MCYFNLRFVVPTAGLMKIQILCHVMSRWMLNIYGRFGLSFDTLS